MWYEWYHATLFINKLNKFITNYEIFKKWLCTELKMRRYLIKFVNEGILTFEIFLYRFQSYQDLINIVGEKNINDARKIFNKLPKNIK